MREINDIVCSCGGKVIEVTPTDEEEKKYGCSKKGCCVGAFECEKCKTKWTFSYAAPDLTYDD